MNGFVWGVLVGAVTMWLWLNGTGPIVDVVASRWSVASRPPAVDTAR